MIQVRVLGGVLVEALANTVVQSVKAGHDGMPVPEPDLPALTHSLNMEAQHGIRRIRPA